MDYIACCSTSGISLHICGPTYRIIALLGGRVFIYSARILICAITRQLTWSIKYLASCLSVYTSSNRCYLPWDVQETDIISWKGKGVPQQLSDQIYQYRVLASVMMLITNNYISISYLNTNLFRVDPLLTPSVDWIHCSPDQHKRDTKGKASLWIWVQ